MKFCKKTLTHILCFALIAGAATPVFPSKQWKIHQCKMDKKYKTCTTSEKINFQHFAIKCILIEEKRQLKKLETCEKMCAATAFILVGSVILPFAIHELINKTTNHK